MLRLILLVLFVLAVLAFKFLPWWAIVLVGVTASGTTHVKAQARGSTGLVSSSALPSAGARAADVSQSREATVESVAATASPTPTVPEVDRDALLAEAMESVAVEDGAQVSVAVLDPETGQSAVYGDGAFDSASIVKVDILAALLLQAQDAGRELTAPEKSYATAMIKNEQTCPFTSPTSRRLKATSTSCTASSISSMLRSCTSTFRRTKKPMPPSVKMTDARST